MHVVIDAEGVTLEQPEAFDRFDVRRRGGADVAATIARHGWGRVDESGDVMVSVERLRASGPDDAEWRQGLDAMIAYASTKGWLDDAGSHIQAHVVEEP